MSKLLQHFPPSPYKQITENPGNMHHILVFLLPTVFCHWHPWCPRMTIQTVKDRTELQGQVQRIQNERCGACVLYPKEDEPKCERCDSSCTECKGPGPLNCTVCPATMQLYLEESRCLPCCSDSDLAGTPECCDCSETQGETMLKSSNGWWRALWLSRLTFKNQKGNRAKMCCWAAGTQCVSTAASPE